MLKRHIVAVASFTMLVAVPALAQDFKAGDVLLRVRAVHLDSANKDRTGLDLSVNNKWLPEMDFTYFLNANLATELVLTVPQKHTLSAGGTEIGTLKHLPPTFSIQYHFPAGAVKPYIGAGVNYTRFSSVNLPAGIDIKRNSVGASLQVGIDMPVGKDMHLNFDVKKVHIGTKVSSGGVELGKFKIDPVLVGVGLGWKF